MYLNEDFEGGKTVFYDPQGGAKTFAQQPALGSAVLFTHEALHEGCAVSKGTKHVLRTDILFRRVLPLKCMGGVLADNADFISGLSGWWPSN